MKRCASIVLTFIALLVLPRVADAARTCTFSQGVTLFSKPGRGLKTQLSGKTTMTILAHRRKWTVLKVRGKTGYIRRSSFKKHCTTHVAMQVAAPKLIDLSHVPIKQPVSEVSEKSSAFGDTYRIKIVVMQLRGSGDIPKPLLLALTQTIPKELERIGPFRAITTHDIKRMVEYQIDSQMLGCDDESCMAELGNAMGADFIIYGNITTTGDISMLQFQLMDVKKVQVDSRVSRRHEGSSEQLYDTVRGASKQLVRTLLKKRSGDLAVSVTEEGATISIDDAIVGVSPLEEPLTIAGGTHRISVEKTGFIVYEKDISIVEDKQTPTAVHLRPSVEFVRQYEEDANFWRLLSWASLGTGAVGITGGVILIASSQAKANRLDQRIKDYNQGVTRDSKKYNRLLQRQREIARYDAMATIGFATGAFATATGILLRLLGNDPARYNAYHVNDTPGVQIFAAPGGVGLVGQF